MATIDINNYLGSKGNSGLHQFIINKMPKHDVYIEPFFGTGVIASKKAAAPIDNIGIELDSTLYTSMSMRYLNFSFFNENSLKTIRYHIDKYRNKNKSVLVYLDPPYLWCTRSDLKTSTYNHELTNEEHEELLSMLAGILNDSNVYLMISGYKNDLYMSMLHGWNYFEFETMSRGGKRTESLWTNFNPDNYKKHDYSFVGKNFTDRQRIKRKSKRWLDKFESMSFDERCSIFQKLQLSMGDL